MAGFQNQNNLVPRSYEHRRALSKMRSKLVTANQRQAGQASLTVHQEPSPARRVLGKGMLAVMLMLVVTANVYSYLQRDHLLTHVEPLAAEAKYAEPQAGWSLDEKAMFWAYAAYEPAKFESRFGPLSPNLLVDRRKAAKQVQGLLEKGSLGPIVEADIRALVASHRPAARPQ